MPSVTVIWTVTNNLWLCGKDSILLYNTKTTQVMRLPNLLEDNITVVEQADDTHFFIATEMGVPGILSLKTKL